MAPADGGGRSASDATADDAGRTWRRAVGPEPAPSAARSQGRFGDVLRRLFGRWRPVGPASASAAARAYRFLARQVAVDLPRRAGRGTVLVLSAAVPHASGNEVTLMFAHALCAELGSRVLLVDGTFGEQGVGAYLGHLGAPGLAEWVCGGDYALADLVRPTPRPGVSVLPAGVDRLGPAGAFEPSRAADLYGELGLRYDHVLVQQRSVLEDTRYLAFARSADLVLLLVEEGVTLVGEVDQALELFRDHQVGHVRLMLCAPG